MEGWGEPGAASQGLARVIPVDPRAFSHQSPTYLHLPQNHRGFPLVGPWAVTSLPCQRLYRRLEQPVSLAWIFLLPDALKYSLPDNSLFWIGF